MLKTSSDWRTSTPRCPLAALAELFRGPRSDAAELQARLKQLGVADLGPKARLHLALTVYEEVKPQDRTEGRPALQQRLFEALEVPPAQRRKYWQKQGAAQRQAVQLEVAALGAQRRAYQNECKGYAEQFMAATQQAQAALQEEREQLVATTATQVAELTAVKGRLLEELQAEAGAAGLQRVATVTAGHKTASVAAALVTDTPGMVRLNVHGKVFVLSLQEVLRHDHSVLAAIFSGDYHLPLDAEGTYRLQLPCTSEQFEQVVDYYHGQLADSFSLQEARRLQRVAIELGLPAMAEQIMARIDRSTAALLQTTTAALQQVTQSLQDARAAASRPTPLFTGPSFGAAHAPYREWRHQPGVFD